MGAANDVSEDATTDDASELSSFDNPLVRRSEKPFELEEALESPSARVQALQLCFGAGGIYAAFLYYGSLQEDVFRHTAADGTHFTQAWFLSVLEALANVAFGAAALVVMGLTGNYEGGVVPASLGSGGGGAVDDGTSAETVSLTTVSLTSGATEEDLPEGRAVGVVGASRGIFGVRERRWWGGTPNLPLRPFVVSGLCQILSKGFTGMALALGLSFPVATLVKSAKMAPVMAGQLVLGGSTYALREYLQVLAIIGGVAMLSMAKKKSTEAENSTLGLVCIVLSLLCSGVVGGVQKRLLTDLKRVNVAPQPYDLMTYTNAWMTVFALVIAVATGEFSRGWAHCARNPELLALVWKFSACSALGQSFVFYTVARFDPLVCATVTTTRKVFSVALSLAFKGHAVSLQGWLGLCLASGGILSEVVHKMWAGKKAKS